MSLFPLDTLKTRLQSAEGFWKSGGFKRIYAGVGPAALGSAPNAALFFLTYEWTKDNLHRQVPQQFILQRRHMDMRFLEGFFVKS